MEKLSYLLFPLIILADILAIRHLLKRTNYSSIRKVLMIVVILIFPVIGISFCYFSLSLSHRV
jgi:hypothetical protein